MKLPALLIGTLLSSGVAFAQTVAPAPEESQARLIRFAGVVQYVSGTTERIASAQSGRQALEYKSVLYEDERFATTTASTLKIHSRNDCVGVVYGASQFLTPEAEKPWRLKADSVRWICAPDAHETVVIRGAVFDLGPGAEIFLEGRKLLVLSGSVKVSGTEGDLPLLKLLSPQGRQWKPDNSAAPEQDAWAFNQSRQIPSESKAFPRPAAVAAPPTPPREKTVRVILSPMFGSGGQRYDVDALKQTKINSEGGRLQVQIKRKTGSLLALINIRSQDEKSGDYGMNTTPPDKVTSNTTLLSLELGYRFQHDRWWSPFVRAGGGLEKPRLSVTHFQSSPSYGSQAEYEFYMLTIAAGVDAYYSPSWFNWAGVYAGADFNLAQSLGRGKRSVSYENCGNCSTVNGSLEKPAEAREPWSMTSYSLQLMLGLFAQF